MTDPLAEIRTLDNLRDFIHSTLCNKENLLAEITSMTQRELSRRGRQCGLQFAVQGPRNVRLGAIWESDHNHIYFYDARGTRYLKVQLPHRVETEALVGAC
ncbi:MAG TPA: hypothetical protein DCE43_22730 [Planctomycetaceae bacterium]|nr:hypothetical protein [Planctomycetaceae bacterium]|tara:strand:- start:980 stop:1282 length:303 start_codon:yes stop_codon:yes gene_type:complete